MKAPLAIALIALVISVGSGILAIRATAKPSEAEMNALVDARLRARELKFVQAYAPQFREMFAAMDDSKFGADWNPTTFEELLAPLVKITSGMDSEPE